MNICGICGYVVIGTETGSANADQDAQRRRLFEALLWAMQYRGEESTGVALCRPGAEPPAALVKRAVDATKLLTLPAYLRLWEEYGDGARVVLGHTRKATRGKVNRRNAHPFVKGRIVGCHNGVVRNADEVNPRAEVDSEVIFETLNALPPGSDPNLAFEKLSGMFAVTWYDTQTRKVGLARGGNPCSLAWAPALQTLFWASTTEALVTAMMAAFGLETEYPEFKDDEVITVDPSASWGSGALARAPAKWKPASLVVSDWSKGWRTPSYGGYIPPLGESSRVLVETDAGIADTDELDSWRPCEHNCGAHCPFNPEWEGFVCPECAEEWDEAVKRTGNRLNAEAFASLE